MSGRKISTPTKSRMQVLVRKIGASKGSVPKHYQAFTVTRSTGLKAMMLCKKEYAKRK